MSADALLCVRNVRVHYALSADRSRKVQAVRGVSFEIGQGESVGLVGESGCGKTSLGRAILRLTPTTSGQILFAGTDITLASGKELRAIRRGLQIVFQDPSGSLDPRMTVGESIGEALDIHGLASDTHLRNQQITTLLQSVGLDAAHAGRYPHEFSGGQRQRIAIARALAVQPSLLVCDEPVSALDVSVQAQIINLLKDLQQQQGLAYLFIAHDLAVVENISQRILVMYLGEIVESGNAKAVCSTPRHPYTQALISAIPTVIGRQNRAKLLDGEPPSPLAPPLGCPFHSRCAIAESKCRSLPPALREVAPGHQVACHLA